MTDVLVPQVRFVKLTEDVVLPQRATFDAVGYDLRAYIRHRRIQLRTAGRVIEQDCEELLQISPGSIAAIPLGFKTQFDSPLEAQIRPRSSLGFSGLIIPNAPGTVDPDYRGEWAVLLANISSTAHEVVHGDRIAQVVFARSHAVEWRITNLDESERSGGFGSTGRS